MIRIVRTALAMGVAGLALVACSKGPSLPPEIQQAMDARHEGFEEIGGAFKKINDALKAGGSLDADLAAAARTINARAQQVSGWFPQGSGPESGRKTDARAEIWQQPDAFAQRREAFVTEAGKLAELAAAEDAAGFAEQVRAVGGTCKGCHDDFRAKD